MCSTGVFCSEGTKGSSQCFVWEAGFHLNLSKKEICIFICFIFISRTANTADVSPAVTGLAMLQQNTWGQTEWEMQALNQDTA